MEQLIMRRKKGEAVPPDWGALVCRAFNGSDADINAWLDIVAEGLTGGRQDSAFFRECMFSHGELEYDKFFIIECEGMPAATFAVICDHKKREGYVHMVACKPEFRGRGIGTKMALHAAAVLDGSGMETAYLTTDDFRVPAIRTYLNAGFVPDTSDPGHRLRWEKILDALEVTK